PELIRQSRIFIAQPPLYLVARGKKSEYVLNERRMRTVLTDLGVEGCQLEIRDEQGQAVRTLAAAELAQALKLLEQLEDLATIVQRRGIGLADFLSLRSQDPEGRGRLPRVRLEVGSATRFFWSDADEQAFLQTLPTGADAPREAVVRKELHEVKE